MGFALVIGYTGLFKNHNYECCSAIDNSHNLQFTQNVLDAICNKPIPGTS
jgi:hypothetical protein